MSSPPQIFCNTPCNFQPTHPQVSVSCVCVCLRICSSLYSLASGSLSYTSLYSPPQICCNTATSRLSSLCVMCMCECVHTHVQFFVVCTHMCSCLYSQASGSLSYTSLSSPLPICCQTSSINFLAYPPSGLCHSWLYIIKNDQLTVHFSVIFSSCC